MRCRLCEVFSFDRLNKAHLTLVAETLKGICAPSDQNSTREWFSLNVVILGPRIFFLKIWLSLAVKLITKMAFFQDIAANTEKSGYLNMNKYFKSSVKL